MTLDAPLTPEEVAPLLRLTSYQVIELCRNGQLAATRPVPSGPWLIHPFTLARFKADGANTRRIPGNPFNGGIA